jgi:hypothetical protein
LVSAGMPEAPAVLITVTAMRAMRVLRIMTSLQQQGFNSASDVPLRLR